MTGVPPIFQLRDPSRAKPSRKNDILNKEGFIFIRMVVRGGPPPWRSNLGRRTRLSSGLRHAKMDDNFFGECCNLSPCLREMMTPPALSLMSAR